MKKGQFHVFRNIITIFVANKLTGQWKQFNMITNRFCSASLQKSKVQESRLHAR